MRAARCCCRPPLQNAAAGCCCRLQAAAAGRCSRTASGRAPAGRPAAPTPAPCRPASLRSGAGVEALYRVLSSNYNLEHRTPEQQVGMGRLRPPPGAAASSRLGGRHHPAELQRSAATAPAAHLWHAAAPRGQQLAPHARPPARRPPPRRTRSTPLRPRRSSRCRRRRPQPLPPQTPTRTATWTATSLWRPWRSWATCLRRRTWLR